MSALSAAVMALIDAGVSGDDLEAAIEKIERGAYPPRSSNALRQERYRRNKRNETLQSNAHNEPSQTVTNRNDVTPSRVRDNTSSLVLSGKKETSSLSPGDFEEVWKAYPHVKGRSSKRKSLAEWGKISAVTRRALPAAVTRYTAEGREPRADCGAPALERWLRDERYLDWLPVVAVPPRQLTQAEKDAHDARILGTGPAIRSEAPVDGDVQTLGGDSGGNVTSLRGQLPFGGAPGGECAYPQDGYRLRATLGPP